MDFEQQRQDYFDALARVVDLMAATAPAQLGRPTPCEQYDVRRLMGHLVGTARRSLGAVGRASTRDVPHLVTDVADGDLAASYASLAERIQPAWLRLRETDPVAAP